MIDQTARILKALGEPTRLKIVKFLSLRELCICELVAILEMSQPRVSQHVNVLRQAGVINERKVRQNTYLSINPDILKAATIGPFKSFMQASIDKITALKDENQRYMNLDNNEVVIACKNNEQKPRGKKIPQII